MVGTRLGRYVAAAVLSSVLQTTVVLMALYAGIDLARESRDLGGGYGVGAMFGYIARTLPARLYDLFPYATLIGTMIGLARLAARNEIIAMRVCGFHRARIVVQVLGVAGVLGLIVMIVGETLAPRLELAARVEREQRVSGTVGLQGSRGLWIRDGQHMIRIGLLIWQPGDRVGFADLRVYALDDPSGMQRMLQARSARHTDEGWWLAEVTETVPGTGTVRGLREPLRLESGLQPEVFRALATRPRLLPMRDIAAIARHLQANGQDSSAYEQAFWRRAWYPIHLLAMLAAGLPVLLGSVRTLPVSLAVFAGVSMGVGFVVVQRLVLGIAPVLPISPAITLLLPACLFGGLALLLGRSR